MLSEFSYIQKGKGAFVLESLLPCENMGVVKSEPQTLFPL